MQELRPLAHRLIPRGPQPSCSWEKPGPASGKGQTGHSETAGRCRICRGCSSTCAVTCNESGPHTSGPGPRPRLWLHVPVGIRWAPLREDTHSPGAPVPQERAAKAGANLLSPLEMSHAGTHTHTHTRTHTPCQHRAGCLQRAELPLGSKASMRLAWPGRNCVLCDLFVSEWWQLHRTRVNGTLCVKRETGGAAGRGSGAPREMLDTRFTWRRALPSQGCPRPRALSLRQPRLPSTDCHKRGPSCSPKAGVWDPG